MERKTVEKKTRVLLFLVSSIFIILVGRLAYLMLLETERFETLAKQNHIRLNPIIAPRGEMYDRNGVKILGNKPVYTVSLVYLGLKETDQVVNRVAGILGMNPMEIMSKLEEQELRKFQPVRLATDVPLETITVLEEQRLDLPGVVIDVEPVRNYHFDSMLSHVLGYVQEIKQEQLQRNQDQGYRLGDMYGQEGLENSFEPYLRGQNGARQVEVDAQARPVRDLGVKEPIPGNNLVLTVDAELQRTAEASLERQVLYMRKLGYESKGGAVVMIDIKTGAIRAMASYPTYNPSIWINGITQKQWEDLQKSGALPNRVLQLYPPASTFKMVLAVAGVDTGKVDPTWAISDPGYYIFGDKAFRDWKPDGHGRVDMRKAISESCNTYFWTIGHRVLGVDTISNYARKFGFGERTGIEIPGEPKGNVPTPDSKYKRNKAFLDAIYNPKFEAIEEKYKPLLADTKDPAERERLEQAKQKERRAVQNQYDQYKWDLNWQVYDTLNMSLGQGYNEYTPLQMVNYVAAIANGGTRWKPYLVQKITSPDGRTIKEFKPQKIGDVGVKPEALRVAQEGMNMVTRVGTASGIFSGFPIQVAGKTGTGEVFGRDNHAVFVAYAPFENPEVAVAAVIDNGGKGGTGAGPVARDLFAAYLDIQDVQQRPGYSPE
ncbi:MAG: penicillin-binding protein 2 [Bacillota bacterium]|nr:penicillin-binding protein 2 [Bacillota bacterium]